MKRFSWITADYFIDVDLPIIAKLREDYQIFWQIIIEYNCKIDYVEYVNLHIPNPGPNLTIQYVYEPCRHRNPRLFFTTRKTLSMAKRFKPDFYYISGYMVPWGLPLLKLMLPTDEVVMACHNVSTPKGAASAFLSEFNVRFVLNNFVNLQVFSKGQHNVLDSRCKGKKVLEAPLALKDYGKATINRDEMDRKLVRFLSFGIIRDYKRIDLLIEAGNQLYINGYRDFRILIAGSSIDWETKYAPMIKHLEVFELQIRRIPNEEVADLFAVSDYFVMPYQDIAQSGAITVAFQYNVPTIVSDIPPFAEFVKDRETGLMFRSESVDDLVRIMQYVIDNHPSVYNELKKNQAEYIQTELSIDSIVAKYKAYFDTL